MVPGHGSGARGAGRWAWQAKNITLHLGSYNSETVRPGATLMKRKDVQREGLQSRVSVWGPGGRGGGRGRQKRSITLKRCMLEGRL